MWDFTCWIPARKSIFSRADRPNTRKKVSFRCAVYLFSFSENTKKIVLILCVITAIVLATRYQQCNCISQVMSFGAEILRIFEGESLELFYVITSMPLCRLAINHFHIETHSILRKDSWNFIAEKIFRQCRVQAECHLETFLIVWSRRIFLVERNWQQIWGRRKFEWNFHSFLHSGCASKSFLGWPYSFATSENRNVLLGRNRFEVSAPETYAMMICKLPMRRDS